MVRWFFVDLLSFAPEIGLLLQKERIVSRPSLFGCKLLVSGLIINIELISRWWLNQPIRKTLSQIGSFAKIGVKIKHI